MTGEGWTMLSLMSPYLAAVCAAVLPSSPVKAPLPAMASAGDLLRVTHRVGDVDATSAFYQALGLEELESGSDGTMLSAAGGAGLSLVLSSAEGAAFQPDAGYLGLSARVPNVADAIAAATAAGGTLLSEAGPVEHGPSYVPEEADEIENIIVEAVVADPSGYPLLLHECAEAPAACLSGARVGVYEWKTSQEWCAPRPMPRTRRTQARTTSARRTLTRTVRMSRARALRWESLGWSTVRWNSNVHREASLTITMAAKPNPAEGEGEAAGPRGPLLPSSDPVIQLCYAYGCKPIQQAADGGLASFCFAASDGAAAELTDPDDYKVLLLGQ